MALVGVTGAGFCNQRHLTCLEGNANPRRVEDFRCTFGGWFYQGVNTSSKVQPFVADNLIPDANHNAHPKKADAESMVWNRLVVATDGVRYGASLGERNGSNRHGIGLREEDRFVGEADTLSQTYISERALEVRCADIGKINGNEGLCVKGWRSALIVKGNISCNSRLHAIHPIKACGGWVYGYVHPSPCTGNQGVVRDVGLPSSLDEASKGEQRANNSNYSYTNVESVTVTPVKLLGCTMLFFAGVVVMAKGMAGCFRFSLVAMLLGALVAFGAGVFVLPL